MLMEMKFLTFFFFIYLFYLFSTTSNFLNHLVLHEIFKMMMPESKKTLYLKKINYIDDISK